MLILRKQIRQHANVTRYIVRLFQLLYKKTKNWLYFRYMHSMLVVVKKFSLITFKCVKH